MTDPFAAGGPVPIGLHRLVPAADGGRTTELAELTAKRAMRPADIIPFPKRAASVAPRRALLFCEICRFPAIFRPAASAGQR